MSSKSSINFNRSRSSLSRRNLKRLSHSHNSHSTNHDYLEGSDYPESILSSTSYAPSCFSLNSDQSDCENSTTNYSLKTHLEEPIKPRFSRPIKTMVIIPIAVAAIAFIFSVPLVQRVELQQMSNSLRQNVFCQDHVVEGIINHTYSYIGAKHQGVVIYFLSGDVGTGKTHTINTLRKVNPKWPQLLASLEVSPLDQLSESDLIETVRSKIKLATLKFIFFDDFARMSEQSEFVQNKLLPLLRSMNTDSEPTFAVIAANVNTIPAYLADEFVHHVFKYNVMNRKCIELCAAATLRSRGENPSDFDMSKLLDLIEFVDKDGTQVAPKGCKKVHTSINRFESEARKPL